MPGRCGTSDRRVREFPERSQALDTSITTPSTADPETACAPAYRDPLEVIQKARAEVESLQSVIELIDAYPDPCALLNSRRQIIVANRALRSLIDPNGASRVESGPRPGEALGCIRSTLGPGGCGTGEFCRTCGALKAILGAGRSGQPAVEDCRLVREGPGGFEQALDLRVRVTPVRLGGRELLILAIQDVSDEKRRRVLERIFFHDVLNTAGALRSISEILVACEDLPGSVQDMVDLLEPATGQLVDEIEAQKTLAAAENGDLPVTFTRLNSAEVLRRIESQYRHHPVGTGKTIRIEASSETIDFRGDPVLILRVIGNMVKNALEATGAGGAIEIGCRTETGAVEFRVRNTACIPFEIRQQIFARSFSTKGPGRGLGTYSIKLLVERYLRGTASFTSTEEEGTTFVVRLPREESTVDSRQSTARTDDDDTDVRARRQSPAAGTAGGMR